MSEHGEDYNYSGWTRNDEGGMDPPSTEKEAFFITKNGREYRWLAPTKEQALALPGWSNRAGYTGGVVEFDYTPAEASDPNEPAGRGAFIASDIINPHILQIAAERDKESDFDKLMKAVAISVVTSGLSSALLGMGAAGGGAASELMGPSALELGVPGATGYAAPAAGAVGGGGALANVGTQQAADALAQSTYNAAAAAGVPGYDPTLIFDAFDALPDSALTGSAGGLEQFTNFVPSAEYAAGSGTSAVGGSLATGAGQAADAIAQSTYDAAAAAGVPGYDPTLIAGTAGSGTSASGGLLDSVINWAKGNPQLASTGLAVGAGLVRGAMSPSPQEQANAIYQAKLQAEVQAADAKRARNRMENINLERLRPTGAMLQRPGILRNVMR